MSDKDMSVKMPHNIILEDRKKLNISGVSDVDSFDEETIIAYTDLGELKIMGSGLHINKLSVESGDLLIEGNIRAISYSDTENVAKGGFFSGLFK
jgi:sporulation protein YabP